MHSHDPDLFMLSVVLLSRATRVLLVLDLRRAVRMQVIRFSVLTLIFHFLYSACMRVCTCFIEPCAMTADEWLCWQQLLRHGFYVAIADERGQVAILDMCTCMRVQLLTYENGALFPVHSLSLLANGKLAMESQNQRRIKVLGFHPRQKRRTYNIPSRKVSQLCFRVRMFCCMRRRGRRS